MQLTATHHGVERPCHLRSGRSHRRVTAQHSSCSPLGHKDGWAPSPELLPGSGRGFPGWSEGAASAPSPPGASLPLCPQSPCTLGDVGTKADGEERRAKGKETWVSAPSTLLSAPICPCHLLPSEIEFGSSQSPCLFTTGLQASLVVTIPSPGAAGPTAVAEHTSKLSQRFQDRVPSPPPRWQYDSTPTAGPGAGLPVHVTKTGPHAVRPRAWVKVKAELSCGGVRMSP